MSLKNPIFDVPQNFKFLLAAMICAAFCRFADGDEKNLQKRWWRGNLHTHSLWSDGDDFPEMIVKRYRDLGYHFLALTDHNILSIDRDTWIEIAAVRERGGDTALANYKRTFGDNWVETRRLPGDEIDSEQVRLKALSEFRSKFESPGEFLLIQAEEISDSVEGLPIHLNATNLQSLIQPMGGDNVIDVINNNIRAVQEQELRNGKPILLHLNHPNFGWAITAEEMAAVTQQRFFEVYNGHPSINHLGDKTRPGVEKMWDIANTIRLDQMNSHALFGLATDDSHHYQNQTGKNARMERGWVMVQATTLDAESLIGAMNAGEFYCSSGVELASVEFKDGQLSLEIKSEPGLTYETAFVGTLKDYNRESVPQMNAKTGKPIRATRIYSDDVGKILATSNSETPRYTLNGNELFVRAVVTSSRIHPRPSFEDQKEQAWTQPVGWR